MEGRLKEARQTRLKMKAQNSDGRRRDNRLPRLLSLSWLIIARTHVGNRRSPLWFFGRQTENALRVTHRSIPRANGRFPDSAPA